MDKDESDKWYEEWRAEEISRLDELAADYHLRGDKGAIIYGLRVCAQHSLVMPDWLRNAFVEATIAIEKHRSWDDVFGNPHKKGTHLKPKKGGFHMEGKVFLLVNEILLKNKNVAIDEALFETVGAMCDISMSQARKLYYQYKKYIEDTLTQNSENS